jgi:hypothetical protein
MIGILTQTETSTRVKINLTGLAVFIVALAPFILAGLLWSSFGGNFPAGGQNYLIQSAVAAADASTTVTLAWTAPGDDGQTGRAQAYDIRYSTSSLGEANWGSATQVQGEPVPQTAGQRETMTVTGLEPNTMYYFGLKSVDDSGNWSALSNIASKVTEAAGQASCSEEWSCTNWSVCSDSRHSRVCTDANECGTTNDRPLLSESCQSSPVCLEEWSCTTWSDCQADNMSRSCHDTQSCGTIENKPIENFDCSGGARPSDDTISPNTLISSAPPSVIKINQTGFSWTGVDDQTSTDMLKFAYQLDSRPWSSWISDTNVTLYDLSNGGHSLKVKSRDLAGNEDPSPATISFSVQVDEFIIAAVNQGGPQIRIFNKKGVLTSQFFAFEKSWRGGVSVAAGDLGIDGRDEIIVSPGPGRAPQVNVFRKNGSLLNSFMAYSQNFQKGVNVALGDFNGDGRNEIVTAPREGGGPDIRIWGMRQGKVVPVYKSFMAYDSRFRGGVSAVACDLEGDGFDEIVTSPQSQGGPQIKVFSLKQGVFKLVSPGFMAYDSRFRGGVNLACGDINGDGRDEIVTAIRGKGGPQLRIFGQTRRGSLGLVSPGFMAYHPSFRGGVSVAVMNIDYDNKDEIMTGVYSGGESLVRIFNAQGSRILKYFYAWPKSYKGGITVSSGQ